MATLVTVAARVLVTLLLFASLFLAVFWAPGILLALFALAFTADARAFSQAVDPRRRSQLIVTSLRRYRGGWLDSPTTAG